MKGLALVVFVEGPSPSEQRAAGFYLAEDTCLNQLARIATFVDRSVTLAIFFEHSEWKWTGRGMRETATPAAASTHKRRYPAARRSTAGRGKH